MSQCPHCQHTLSQDELHSGKCPSCGHAWQSPRPDAPPKPGSVLGDFAEDSLPQAISGVGKHGTGLSSATEPETWNVDSNAVTHDASELLEARQRGPQPLELDADDIVRMSILWQGIEDEVPAGMTIKSQEVDIDDLDEKMGTVDVAELQNAEDLEDVFRADESSKTFSPGVEPADNGSGAEAGSSDEFPPASSGQKSSAEKEWLQDSISDTFLSDDFPSILPEAEEKIAADSQSHDTPSQSAGTSSYDQTFVAPDSVSAEQDSDSQNFSDEEGKTLPLSGEGDWIAAEDSKTFAGAGSPQGARTTEDDASIPGGQDSADIEKTLISNDLSGENYTDSGSTDGGRRTDPLASGEILGPDLAEGTGLVIQTRSLRPQDEAESDSADYQILSLLGEGGMGQVFNARQTSIDRVVAVKMLKARSSSRKRDQHTKFLAEAVVTGELDHPNIVPIYDVGRDQNNALFYSMKNVTGNPWLDTIHQKSVHDNLEILMSVADAVAFAHARGVVHRDLKPENVMLGEFGEVLLMDWGLAMPTDRFRKQRGIVRSSSMGGTPAYMAPEMATGPITKIGSHSDIYLLGAILFEIVTGRPPHRGKNAMKCLMSAARNKIVHTEHTGELIEIAYKAMSTDPKDRYKSVQEFQAAVRTYLAHSESINLAAVAEEDLERAQKTDSYEDYAKARFGFEEALKLWEGNKRARSSLAAARLAYAHCAMGKEDYDLAASLLDTSDKTHDKLRVDIAKAREERDARQKRLEAAKRAGRVMLAALFLVVTGATFWINNERAKAVASEKDAINAKELADEARREAEDQRVKAQRLADQERDLKEAAEEARDEARQANVIAEQRRKAALAQQIMASLNALLAEEQRLVAEEQRRIAEQAKKDVEEALVRVQDARRQEAEQRALAEAQKVMAGINAIYAEQQALVAQQAADAERAAKEQEARQRRLAVKQRELAEAQQVVAGLNAIMADEQKQLAEVQRRAADLQRQLAEDARKEAVKAQKAAEEAKLAEEQEAYISKVGLAAAKIEANAFDAAKELLLGTNPIFRNWEWGYLTHLCESYDTEYKSSQRLESVALIGDGQQFVIAGEDGLVEIRSLEPVEGTPAVIQDLSLPNKANVYDIAVSPDGRYIALATDDVREGFIKLWDRTQNQWTPTRFGSTDVTFRSAEEYYEKHESRHMDPVVSVQFSQDGTKLLTGSEDKSARVWDVTTGRQLARLFGTDTLGQTASVWDAVFCPNFERDADDRILADRPLPETKVLTACEDGKVRIWADAGGEWNDPAKIRLEGHFDAHQGSPVYSLACSPNGEYVVSGSFDRRVLLWRPKDIPQISQQRYYEMLINNEPVPQTPYRELVGHTGPVHCVRFGSTAPSDARSLVVLTCSDDNTVKVWSVDREASLGRVSPIKTFRGHGSYVRDCTFNPSGTWILSVSHDRTAKRWSVDEDAKTEVYLVNGSPLDGHKENVDAVAFSFNGKTKAVATASRDRTAQIYSLEGENHLKHEAVITEGHSNLIPSGVYFNDGKKLATAGFDNTARLWDARTGSEILKLERTGFAGVIAVSPDGRWILTGSDNPTQFETDAKRRIPWKAKLWDAESPEKPVLTFGRHLYEVTAVAFSNRIGPKGELLFATAGGAGICSVWRWTPGDKEPAEQQIVRFKGGLAHNDRIVGLRFLPGDQQLVSASYDYAVTCWDVTKEKPAAVWDLNHPKRVSSMDVTADGRLLVTTCFDDTIRIWNTQNHELVRELRPEGRVYTLLANVADELGRKKYPNNTLERAWRLINPDLNYQDFIKRGGWTQAVQSIQSQIPSQLADSLKEPPRQLARQLAELFDGVSAEDLLLPKTDSVAISPDGRYVVAANRIDRMAHGWRLSENLTADSQLTTFDIEGRTDEDVWAVLFSPEVMRANVVLLGFSDARQFHLNTAADGRVITTPSITWSGQEEVVSASFSPDGQYLVTGSRDRAARVWNVRTGRNLIKLEGAHTAPINAAVWAPRGIPGDPEGHYILTVSDLGRVTAALWKLTPFGEDGFRKELVRTFPGHTDNVLDAAFSPDGRWIVTVSRDRTIRLWETASGKEVTKSQPQEDAVLCVAFAADGKRILTGSAANEAVIWSVAVTEAAVRLEPQLLLEGHSAPVTDVAFSPLEDLNHDGRISEFERYALRAVTASDDNSVIVWDTRVPTYSEDAVPQANQVLTLKRHDRPVKAVQFSPDGRYILTGSEDHRAILWPSKDWMAEKLAEYEKNPNLKIPANSEVTASDEVSAK